MAIHEDSKNSDKKSADEIPIFNAENLQSNMKSIYYSRTFLSIIAGVVAGIWGFTSLTGFVFYFLIMMLTSLGLALKAKLSVHKYFDSWNQIIFDGFFGGLMSFVLFWTYAALPMTLFTSFKWSFQPFTKAMQLTVLISPHIFGSPIAMRNAIRH